VVESGDEQGRDLGRAEDEVPAAADERVGRDRAFGHDESSAGTR
jgi:hypothetical protein